MPTDGPAVFQGLQAGLNDAERFIARCDQSSAALDQQIQELLSRRGEALIDLARHFLPEVSRPAIESTFSGIRGDLLNILARKEQRQRELRAELDSALKTAHNHESEIEQVTAKLNQKVAEREKLEAQVAETLKKNDDFQERSRLALEAEELLHRNEQRVAEITKDASEKLPHYDRSRLFRYLYDRKYGTNDYNERGIILELDRWVAKLIRFGEAKGSYEFLKRTPELVAAEVERRKQIFAELMQQVEAIQKEEADRSGLTAVLAEGNQLGDRRDELVRGLETLRGNTEQLQQAIAELGQRQNSFYAEAIERFRDFLGETRLALIEQRAKQTPEPDDDAIVAEIARLDDQIDGLKPQVVELADRRGAADRARSGLDVIVRRFRQSNFDSQRSYFEDGFDLNDALNQFQTGTIDLETFWANLRSYQQFRPHWVEQTARGTSDMVTGPAGRVILGAVLDVANAAMREAAYRGVQRRGEIYFPQPQPQWFPGPSQAPEPMPAPPPAPAPASAPAPAPDPAPIYIPPIPPMDGSFTSGEGF